MISGYQCNFCSTFKATYQADEMKIHEVTCTNNPAAQKCATCEHHELIWWDGHVTGDECHKNVDVDERPDWSGSDETCNLWELKKA